MAELRVKDFDDDLMARVKAAAALARVSIKEYVEMAARKALSRKVSKEAR
jgi:hypothetical protein